MDWTKFNNHGESPNHAFEVMCNILFKCWLKKEYKDNISHFAFVNGSGGDGGVEAYGLLKSGDIIGVQSKWFPQKMEASQFKQIEICITKISTFLILCDLAVCLATLYVSFSLVFALMRYLQGKVFLIRFYSPTTLSSSRAEFRLPSRLACA